MRLVRGKNKAYIEEYDIALTQLQIHNNFRYQGDSNGLGSTQNFTDKGMTPSRLFVMA